MSGGDKSEFFKSKGFNATWYWFAAMLFISYFAHKPCSEVAYDIYKRRLNILGSYDYIT